MEGLSINYMNSTNEDVVVTYTPSSLVSNYSYIIIKNNEYGRPVFVNSNIPVDIVLTDTGTYRIEITNIDYNGISSKLTSGEYKIDKESPIINLTERTYKIKTNENLNIKDITASDAIDGDLTTSIKSNINTIDFSKEGIKEIKYSVSDNAGNTATQTVFVTVKQDNTNLIKLGQVGALIVLVTIIIFLCKYIRSIKLEKRFSKYTINSSKNKSISLFDNLYIQYLDFVDKVCKVLSKSKFIKNRSKKYDKYVVAFGIDSDSIKIICKKVIVGFVYVIFVILLELIQSKLATSIQMIISFIIGFYTLDIIYYYKYIKYRKKIENDLLEAITIMNNAFKAGMSITQSIDLVSKELVGPISNEFKKISTEISLGLDIEVAFKRFSDRIKSDEAVYLTSSLSVLNKTGGNIIKVFNSIEKNMFNRRKLDQELKALTSSSKLIMYVLMIVPVVFVLFIGLINKEYFKPLFTHPLGIVLSIIILIIYVTYIIVVRRVLKVRGIK